MNILLFFPDLTACFVQLMYFCIANAWYYLSYFMQIRILIICLQVCIPKGPMNFLKRQYHVQFYISYNSHDI